MFQISIKIMSLCDKISISYKNLEDICNAHRMGEDKELIFYKKYSK